MKKIRKIRILDLWSHTAMKLRQLAEDVICLFTTLALCKSETGWQMTTVSRKCVKCPNLQGSVATWLRCRGIFKYNFITNLPYINPYYYYYSRVCQ